MTIETIKTLSKNEVQKFIRERLAFNEIADQIRYVDRETFKKEHRRFNMTGYDDRPGETSKFNKAIIDEFADLGIYDYTEELFLNFRKGHGTLHLKYIHDAKNQEIELGGYTTTEIIYRIFENTIFSDLPKKSN
ncbi:MAG: hypothetical protein A3D31_17455 [Candidatus Fluviicola riflensis]|nr:MAG: hypothetical protein CHH17_02395 [Candidatus Fluviicola riflensis]OGS76955.1 MAG: hypothetical protein A3D31_17455 [Candidatus Fluviicola riflensis]OGS83093.1 MAG: hypothetical protein A2724_13905 [Fluviicola sp. RIFCSPHIGHO2_01_FULL_43_53]OGS88684.1 MAG: hypothetical protein A3E30_06960 [Fluviicola sp. RIFCSPHIGHO2_12_FULL_43_24]